MKKIYSSLLIFLFLFSAFNLYGQSGIFESYVIVDGTYYDIHSPTDNSNPIPSVEDFDGKDFGPIPTSTGSLILNGGQNNIYKCPTHDVTTGVLDYVIYPTGSRPATPTFTGINLNDSVATINNTACSGSGFDQAWLRNDANIDLISGLTSGDYTLEAYTLADYTVNGVLSPTPHYVNNNANNFTATFRADNPPVANCVSALTVQLDASGNATITVLDINNGSSDDFDAPSLTIDIDTFDCTNIGTPVTVTLTAEDSLGQIGICTATITVEDNVNPTITCPANQTGNVDGSCDFVLPDYTALAAAADNCSVTVTQVPAAGTIVGLGTTNIVLTASDGTNSVDCNFDVIVSDTTAPTITCPANQTGTVDGSCDFVLPDYTALAAAADNCSVTVTQVPAAGTIVGLGTTNIVLTASDGTNSVDCDFDVVVSDTTAPTITCPANQTGNVDGSCDFVLPDYTALAAAADNCSVTVTQVPAAGTIVGLGTTNIVLTASDGTNSVDCNFDVIVSDTTAPTITCPANQTGNVDGSCDFVLPDYTALAAAADNCSVTVTQVPAAGTIVGLGTTNIVLTASDGTNSVDCNFDVIVSDTTAPTITCPANQTGNVDGSCDFVLPDYTALAAAADNCSVTVTQVPAPGTTVGLGTTNIVLTASDGTNSVDCNFDVIVSDTTPPTITCPANITISNDADACDAVVTYAVPFSDNCPGSSISQTAGLASGDSFPIGTTTNTFVVTDASGNNTATCSFTVTVNDTQDPTLTCPANITVSNDADACDAVVTYAVPFSDNCPGSSISQTAGLASGDSFPIGTTTNTFVVTDASGNNTATCSFTVTVNDTQDPTLTCPADITVSNDADTCDAVVTYNVPFSDNCPGSSINQTTGLASGDSFPIGTTTNTFVVTDASGNNTATCSFTVTVNDTQDPTLTCPANITVSNDADACDAVVTYAVPFSDNCPGSSISQTAGLASGDSFPIGTTTNTFVVTDASGNNTATCSFTVTVNDTQDPTLTCPADITVSNDADTCGAVVTYNVPFGDNCAGSTINQTTGLASGSAFPIGTTTNTFVVTDASGNNTATCSFTVTVNDTQDPTLTCPADITVSNDADTCDAVVTYAVPFSDNCPGSSISQTAGLASGDSFPIGTTTNTFVVTDASGNNTATCSFTVTVNDTQDPTLTCPANITVSNDADACDAVVTYAVPFSDNCPGSSISQTAGLASGDSFPIGTTTNTFVVTDASGNNTATCSFTVTVNDTQDPTLTCPANITVSNDADACDAVVTYAVPFSDNCPGSSISQTAGLASGDSFPIGTTTNTFLVTDASGNNTATCSFTVTVNDTQDPTLTCPADITVSNDADTCGAVVTYNVPFGDNCTGSTINQTTGLASGSAFPIGTTTNTFVVTDASGNNTATCSFTVTVNDTQNPTAICQDVTVQLDVNGNASITAAQIDNNSTDNCGVASISVSPSIFDCSNVGGNTVTLTVTDDNGNASTCTAAVTVEDNVAPVALCQAVTVQLDAAGNGSITTTDIDNGSNDACGIASLSLDTTAFTCANIGANTVTLTVTDNNGNVSTCTAAVTVEDNVAPVALCQAVTVQLDAAGNGSITTTDIDNGSNDACGIASLSLDTTAFTCANIGANTVTLTVTDNNGNVSTCTAAVTVEDNVALTAPTLPVITGQCSATVPMPTIADACAGTITGTTSDPLTYNTQGSFGVTWNFDDGNGNSINVVQNVVINDTVDPVAVCQDLTIQLDNITGLATITASQLDNGSTDNCGVVSFLVSQNTFDCTNIGTNVIVLTVDDGNGNTDTCTATVTVASPTISGGTVLGFLNNNQTIADEDNLVEVTACPDEPQNGTFNLYGQTGTIAYWQTSNNGGVTWTNVANTTTTYYYPNILETTLIRAVIQIGSCQANSSIIIVAVIPPDIPPTIIGPDEFTICLGESITVEAESSFGINPDLNEGGMFNQADLNNLGWAVDGAAEMSAGGNNTNNTYWKLTNGPKKFNGRCFESPDEDKFAVVSGIPPFENPDHTITPISTLETSTFNTLGMSTATLEFDQAYFLEAGAWARVELSLDDGASYNIILDPGAAYDYTGPSDTGFVNGDSLGFNGQCRNSPGTLVDNHVSIDLQNYIGLIGLRIKFTYSGTANSTWALENITIPQAPVDEVIEWEDGTGTVVTTGSSTTITPVTPGVQTYGVTSLINGCRADGPEGTEFVSVNASLAYAGKNITPISGECGQDIVSLNAYDNTLTAAQNIGNDAFDNNYITGTYPGTGEAGVWNVVTAPTGCGNSFSFSNLGDPRATFTGDPGTYTLSWTVDGCTSTVDVTLDNCQSLDFDGVDDYVSFQNNYDVSNSFSIEAWVKPESVSGIQTIFSKRDANNQTDGYDLSLNGSIVYFNWNNGLSIQSSHPISTNRWYHIAVTYDNTNYRLYIDGIEVSTPVSSVAPTTNSRLGLIGAMDQTGNPPNRPVRYFNGWIDELRIWSTQISEAQIRQMMNQEIVNNTLVRGTTVPLDIVGLNWADLDGYYRMDVNCGFLTAYKGIRGRLRNINSAQQETAPLPYTSRIDGQDWATDNTWTNFNVWDAPNSIGIDGATPIDWNIVQISHDINSGDKDITVLGLISDVPNKVLDIKDPGSAQDETNDGQFLRVTHYLKLDGDIDLFGESQLLQDEGSVLDVTSSGKLERDQQGTANLYNYNYWSSPVSALSTTSNNNPYSINDILRDGTNSGIPLNLQWTTSQNADGSTTPITQSSRWLYAYENFPVGNTPEEGYAQWRDLAETDVLATGLSFTMKGSGAGDPILDVQNYVFVGKPNNGTITTPLTIGNQALVGNPYPSAIDADQFIRDNIFGPEGNPGSTQSINGTLYFWEHYTSNFTHILEDYEGGYATFNLSGGLEAVSGPLVSTNGTATKRPGQFIPVSQGFFVSASNIGGAIQFKNSQRVFEKETLVNSQFIRTSYPNMSVSQEDPNPEIQRVRINFTTEEGAIRPLLLAFVPNGEATDGFDFGYDAENADDEFTNDMFWRIEDGNYTTQGVGDFDISKQYPLGLFINAMGTFEISLKNLENFDEDVQVYIYDSLLGSYFEIKDEAFQITLDPDTYLDRFYVTFSSEDTLSIPDDELSQTTINYLNTTKEIYVRVPMVSEVKEIQLINLLGQEIQRWDNTSEFELDGAIRIPVKNISEGTYIIKVNTISRVNSSKVIVKE